MEGGGGASMYGFSTCIIDWEFQYFFRSFVEICS